jgi:hypothetical protein
MSGAQLRAMNVRSTTPAMNVWSTTLGHECPEHNLGKNVSDAAPRLECPMYNSGTFMADEARHQNMKYLVR